MLLQEAIDEFLLYLEIEKTIRKTLLLVILLILRPLKIFW
ncbi:UNVERIFIED_ORG: hypothetical protein ABRZ91_000230 [Heyndrickxia coagulans]